MNRPRALLIRAGRRASEAVAAMRAGLGRRATPEHTELASVQRRLEFLVAAMYGSAVRIEAAERMPPEGLTRRLARRVTRERSDQSLAESDATTMTLPRRLVDSPTSGPAIEQYRLLAIEQAERIKRGTAASLPEGTDPLVRDLYLLAESVAVDASISANMKGMAETIGRARRTALAARPEIASLRPIEAEVERIARDILSAGPETAAPHIAASNTPDESLEWARANARRIRAEVASEGRVYRGIAPVAMWGTVKTRSITRVRTEEERILDALNSAAMLDTHIRQEGGSGPDGSNKDSESGGEGEELSDNAGDGPESSPDDEATSSELVAAPGIRPPDEAGELRSGASESVPDANVPTTAKRRGQERVSASHTFVYPEWDCNAKAYRVHGATVRSLDVAEPTGSAAAEILAKHGPIVRSLRQRFERLRARRIQLPRQRDGDELDLAACVRSLVDIRTGHSSDDRFYVDTRPARRALAITLLVDVSGSTGDRVTDELRVIDVERIALFLASEALDALGDRYSILTFSSYGAADVRVSSIKTFGERNGETVRQRIVAIEPAGKTRLGAAVRHACAQLARQSVGHRILLILSDGKPNDTDRYFEHYASEDTRQAILEARAQGVYPFCLTVDRQEGSEYLSHIFGPAGHTILRNPEQLPVALVHGMQHLLAS